MGNIIIVQRKISNLTIVSILSDAYKCQKYNLRLDDLMSGKLFKKCK